MVVWKLRIRKGTEKGTGKGKEQEQVKVKEQEKGKEKGGDAGSWDQSKSRDQCGGSGGGGGSGSGVRSGGGAEEPAECFPPRLLRPLDLPPGYAAKLGADPRDFFIIGMRTDGAYLVLNRRDRVHMAVFGEPGMGKSTFLLLQIVQHIRNNEGCVVIDPHGDLAKKVLSVVPKDKWDRVVYIDPTTAGDYNRVVKIALLECADPSRKGLVAMGFVDSLKKMYEEFWGPRLERILLNAVYAIMEQPELRLTDLYDIIMDPVKREQILANVRDEMVIRYWTNEFPLLKDDAPTAVTNKICRLIQEKIVAPMFDCSRSSVDFGEAMNEGKIIVVNLSEGRLTADVANFLGALLLNKIYQEGMARENMPEDERRPFFVYIDEAHRFVTTSLKDILQALRKYKVYVTLAAQYLGQFDRQGGRDRTLTEAIPQLCDTLAVFAVGADTALSLEPYFKSIDRYTTRDTLTTLKRYQVVFLVRRGGNKYVKSGWCIDLSPYRYADPEEVIRRSLELYGREVDVRKYQLQFQQTPVPEMEPASFMILSYLFYKRDCRPTPLPSIEGEMRKYGFTESETNAALRGLLFEKLLEVETVATERGKTVRYFSMTEQAKARFRDVPQGQRGGGPEHTAILGRYVSEQRQNGFYCIVDRGDDPKRELPDVIVFPPQYLPNGKIHPRVWDYAKKFAVEIETDPYHHRDRVIHNWEKCYKYGLPVNFITTSFENKEMIIGLLSDKATVVQNILKEYSPGNVQVDRVTASGEIIRSYEEDAVEGSKGRTEVEELIDKMKGMSPAEKFDLLVGRGWRPFVHVSASKTKEIHARKDGLPNLYVGRYEELREKYERLAAERPELTTTTATATATTAAAAATAPTSVKATTPIPESKKPELESESKSEPEPEPEPTTAQPQPQLQPQIPTEAPEPAPTLTQAPPEPTPVEAPTPEPELAPPSALPTQVSASVEALREELKKLLEEQRALAEELKALREVVTALRAAQMPSEASAPPAEPPTPKEAPPHQAPPLQKQQPPPSAAAPTEAPPPGQELPAPQSEAAQMTPQQLQGRGKGKAQAPSQIQTAPLTGDEQGQEQEGGEEEEQEEAVKDEDEEDRRISLLQSTIKEVVQRMVAEGVKEAGAKELYEAVRQALKEKTGKEADVTLMEFGLTCNTIGIKKKHTKQGKRYRLAT